MSRVAAALRLLWRSMVGSSLVMASRDTGRLPMRIMESMEGSTPAASEICRKLCCGLSVNQVFKAEVNRFMMRKCHYLANCANYYLTPSCKICNI